MEKTWNSCESFQGLFLIKFHHEGIDNSQKSKTTQDSNRRNCRLCSLQIMSVFIILSLERNHAKIVSMGKLHCKKHWTKMLVAHDNKQVRNTVDSGWDWVTQSAPTHKWHVCHVHLLAPVNHIPTCLISHLPKKHLDEPKVFWDNVLWSDESEIKLGRHGSFAFGIKLNTAFHNKIIIATVNHGAGSEYFATSELDNFP